MQSISNKNHTFKEDRTYKILSRQIEERKRHKKQGQRHIRDSNFDLAVSKFNSGIISRLVKNNKVLYVRIPETGGSSVLDFLGISEESDMRYHYWSAEHQIKYFYGQDIWNEAFSFSFVRNPWGRAISWYTFCKKTITSSFWNHYHSFEQWVKEGMHIHWEDAKDNHFSHGKIFWCQKRWVTDNEWNSLVSYVGKFEELQENMNQISEILGVIPVELSIKNIECDYRKHYDKEMVDIVRKTCKIDIEEYEYEF